MHVQSLHISDLRCFEAVSLELRRPGRDEGLKLPNVNLVLGNNGAGKTTILRAVALATLAPLLSSAGFVPYHLVRRGRDTRATEARVSASVALHAQDTGNKGRDRETLETVSTRIRRIHDVEQVQGERAADGPWERMFDDRSPAFLVVGYGASRRVESAGTFDESVRGRSRQLRYQRVAGLFEDSVTLVPLGAWLPRFQKSNPGRHKQVVTLINHVLPDECRFVGELEGVDYVFELRGVRVPFGALSDGYRAYIGWVADLLYHVCMGAPSGSRLVENRGIVLVDEIDLHLHPEWQRTVVPRLAEALPNLQFILTTHSPIVAGTLQRENIFVSTPDPSGSGASVVAQLDQRVHGLSAEQILLSPYFNLETTRAEDMEDELLGLTRKARAGDRDAALEYMRRLANGSAAEDGAPQVGARARQSRK